MKKISALLLCIALSLTCFASTDTLLNDPAIKTAREKVVQTKKQLKAHIEAAEQAKKKDELVKKEFDQAVKAFETATNPKDRNEALTVFSKLTEEHIQAIDDALLTEDQVRKSKLALEEAEKELEDVLKKMDWAKSRVRNK